MVIKTMKGGCAPARWMGRVVDPLQLTGRLDSQRRNKSLPQSIQPAGARKPCCRGRYSFNPHNVFGIELEKRLS